MSGSRTFIANAEKIDTELQRASQCKDCRDSIRILEALQADQHIKLFLTQNSSKKSELLTAYQSLIRTLASELYQLSEYIAAQLDELDNIKTDTGSPASHINASTAFNNLSHYLVDDILSSPDAETRILALKRWLKILSISMNSNDYHSAAAIHAGLNNAALGRLQTLFIHLSNDEKSLLEKINETFIRDQGWRLMNEQLQSNGLGYFIPSLAGIKKAATKAKEARQAHSMHAEFLESEGKLTRSSTLSAANSISSDDVKSTSKTSFELLTELIQQLKQSSHLKSANQLTQLQRHLTQTGSDQADITIKPINYDEGTSYAIASQFERDEIPNTLKNLQNTLHKSLRLIASQKKLQEPLKSIKKSLSKINLESILSAQFAHSNECKHIEDVLSTINNTGQQTNAVTSPTLSRTKTKPTSTNIDLPDITTLHQMLRHIISLKKRHERLMQESSAPTTSLLSSTSSTSISSASTSTSSSTHSQLNTTDLTMTSANAAPSKETTSIQKRDAASEKGFLSRHGSMTMTPRKSSPPSNITPQGSPGITKNKK